ncbi:MAG: hypothetical protein AAF845_09910 [Bacteroidota bacterium]
MAFFVGDPFYAPAEDVRAEMNGRRLRGDAIQTFTPPSEDVFLQPGEIYALTPQRRPEPGDVFAYRYRRTYVDPAYAPILKVPNVDRVERFEIAVRHPASVTAGFDVVTPRGGELHTVERRSDTETVLTFADLSAADDLPLFPYNDAHASVRLQFDTEAGPILPTDAPSFAAWYERLVEGAVPDTLSASLQAVAEGLRRETERETVSAIHDHVRGSIRYVADERAEGAFVPRAPDLVASRGYGDCKDRAFLVRALAAHLGIDVDVVLISTEAVPAFEGAHVFLYNHVINAYGEGDEAVYFDPTHRYVPFGSLPEGDVDGQALRLGAQPAQVRVAALEADPMLDVRITASLAAPDAAEATVTVRGDLFGAVQEAMAVGRRLDAENLLSGASGAFLYKIRLGYFEPVDVGETEATFRAEADLSEFVVASPTRRYLPHTPFRAVPAETAERANDALPVYTDWRPDARLVLDLDAGAWQAAPDSVAFGAPADAAHFAARLGASGERTVIDYRFRQRTRRFAGPDRDPYLAFADRYLGARRGMFIFRAAEAASTNEPAP